MVVIRSRVDGTRKLRSEIADIRRRYPRSVLSPAMKKAAEVGLRDLIMGRFYINRTWALRRSSDIEQERRRSGRFSIGWSLVSGGRSAPYAEYVNNLTNYFNHAVGVMRRAARSILPREARRQSRRFRPRG